jgi:hypothetical protein
MPLPEHEFRRRLRMVTGEFVNLLLNPERIDSAPAEVRLYGPSFAVGELWSVFVRERREVTFANTVSGQRLPSGDVPSRDLPENVTWSGPTLFPRHPGEVTNPVG